MKLPSRRTLIRAGSAFFLMCCIAAVGSMFGVADAEAKGSGDWLGFAFAFFGAINMWGWLSR